MLKRTVLAVCLNEPLSYKSTVHHSTSNPSGYMYYIIKYIIHLIRSMRQIVYYNGLVTERSTDYSDYAHQVLFAFICLEHIQQTLTF